MAGQSLRQPPVGLDIKDGGAVHKVGTLNCYYRTFGRMQLYAFDTHRGKTNVVGTEGTACSPDTHATIATKTRRTHGCLKFEF